MVKGKWEPIKPDPTLLERTTEPHDRGAILVAAVFAAFTKVYQARTRDLFRIATEGTGVLREGDIHPDLVNRLAEEAERCSDRALQMCIRAIDYCPPVGITFGAYLRAIITADHDMNPADRENWRLAFIESFREWGIYPRGTRSMAEDSLLWPDQKDVADELDTAAPAAERRYSKATRESIGAVVTRMFQNSAPQQTDERYSRKASRAAPQQPNKPADVLTPAGMSMSRFRVWLDGDRQAAMFHSWLMAEDWTWLAHALGLVVDVSRLPKTISANKRNASQANIEIHSVRTAMKRGVLGFPEPHMVVVVTQWRAGFFDRKTQKARDKTPGAWDSEDRDFKYRAGCTLLIDPEETRILRVIRTPGNVANEDELDRMRRYLLDGLSPPNAFAQIAERLGGSAEPFALLHSQLGE
jgi:hypothetical protein